MEHKAVWEQDEAAIGRTLRRSRREQGISLEEAEQVTKIRKHYLESLERENYDAMPAPIYVHGFLKSYASYLGLDADRLSAKLSEDWKPPEGRQPEISFSPVRSRRAVRRRSARGG